MCTIVALFGMRTDFPLVLATNRDEFYARETLGPGRILRAPVTVGGLDLRARGTWMGVTRQGLFVGVTNQRTLTAPDPQKRSRGELVMNALKLQKPKAIAEALTALDGREYNSFNLMFGTAEALYVAYGREAQREIEVTQVQKGLHVLPNDKLDSPDFWKVSHAHAQLAEAHTLPRDALLAKLQQLLADGRLPPSERVPDREGFLTREVLTRLMALCVRTPAYGTRSSSVILLAPGEVCAYRFADGPPDTTAFQDVMPLYNDALGQDAPV